MDEKNYLCHYGRKGMKWRKHIYKKDDPNFEDQKSMNKHAGQNLRTFIKKYDPNFVDVKSTNKHTSGNLISIASKMNGVSYKTGGNSKAAKRMLRGKKFIDRFLSRR